MAKKKTVSVKKSKQHRRGSGWIRGHWRRKSKLTTNNKYKRSPPRKKKNKKQVKKKRTIQTTFGKPKGPAKIK